MKAQEEVHVQTFAGLIADRRVRPTALLPLWHRPGFALGAVTAALGERAAMACTVAVEEAIDEHYAHRRQPGDDEAGLRSTIERFRAEELEHRDIGLENEAELAPGYRLMSPGDQGGLQGGDRGERAGVTLRVLASQWGGAALVCRKCGKKLGGGFGRKNKHGLADTLQAALKEAGRRRAVRVVETGCLGICPKGAVAVATGDRVLVVDAGTPADQVIAAIVPPPLA